MTKPTQKKKVIKAWAIYDRAGLWITKINKDKKVVNCLKDQYSKVVMIESRIIK